MDFKNKWMSNFFKWTDLDKNLQVNENLYNERDKVEENITSFFVNNINFKEKIKLNKDLNKEIPKLEYNDFSNDWEWVFIDLWFHESIMLNILYKQDSHELDLDNIWLDLSYFNEVKSWDIFREEKYSINDISIMKEELEKKKERLETVLEKASELSNIIKKEFELNKESFYNIDED